MSDKESHGSGPLDLNLLRTFLAVHRTGSFTAAARWLGLSQPTVTTQIKALEQRLGQELFQRRARGVTPLPHADELAERLAAPLDRLADVADLPDARGVRAPEPVDLAGPAEFLCTVLLAVLAPLAAEGVRLRVALGQSEPLLEELRAGRHDLVVAKQRPRGRALTAEPFADEEFVLVTAPAWAERLAQETRPDETLPDVLPRLPLVGYAANLPIERRYWRHVFDRPLQVEAAITVPDLRGVVAALVAGAGWGVVSSYLCRAELASGALRLLHRPTDPPINTAYLVQRSGPSRNPHLALVRQRLLEAAKAW